MAQPLYFACCYGDFQSGAGSRSAEPQPRSGTKAVAQPHIKPAQLAKQQPQGCINKRSVSPKSPSEAAFPLARSHAPACKGVNPRAFSCARAQRVFLPWARLRAPAIFPRKPHFNKISRRESDRQTDARRLSGALGEVPSSITSELSPDFRKKTALFSEERDKLFFCWDFRKTYKKAAFMEAAMNHCKTLINKDLCLT